MQGPDGKNFYLVVQYSYSYIKVIKAAQNKTLPVELLLRFLATYAPDKLQVGIIRAWIDKDRDLD